MAKTITLSGVPNSDVPRVKEEFEDEGATVTVTSDGADTSTVLAAWPDGGAVSGAVDSAQLHASAAAAHSAAAAAHAAAASALTSATQDAAN